MKTGVLLMSLGSPENLEDMEAYLLNIRNGRKPSAEFVEEIKRRYKLAGGKSPLLEISRKQARALEALLRDKQEGMKIYVGMRHWRPFIKEAVREALQDGVTRLVSLPLTPYYSRISVDAYHEKVREALDELGGNVEVVAVKSWHDHPLLLETFANLIRQGFSKFGGSREGVQLLFTAHSLPERIVEEGDPYPEELNHTATLLVEKINFRPWYFAYQSQGGSPEPWLGPSVEKMLEFFQVEQVRKVLLAPIGFVADHMEILYDIDILFKGLASEKGIRLERSPSPNDSRSFIETLASVVLEHLSLERRKA